MDNSIDYTIVSMYFIVIELCTYKLLKYHISLYIFCHKKKNHEGRMAGRKKGRREGKKARKEKWESGRKFQARAWCLVCPRKLLFLSKCGEMASSSTQQQSQADCIVKAKVTTPLANLSPRHCLAQCPCPALWPVHPFPPGLNRSFWANSLSPGPPPAPSST